MDTLELPPPVFAILKSLVEERVGLHYGLLDRELLQTKASARAIDAGFDSLLDYYYYLRYDPSGEQEIQELIESLVVGETYFFREWPSIRALVDRFIAPWCAAGRRPRVWSAACATGEEPLSLAMLLDARGLLQEVELVASDVSARALARAARARYGARSVRQVPEPELAGRYLRRDGGGYEVAPELVAAIRWSRRNLLRDEDVAELGPLDAILCRNVLIYFSDDTVRSVLDRLARALVDDGVLVIGVSESLLRYGSGLVGEERDGAFVYRKAARR